MKYFPFKLIDLSHTLTPEIPAWDQHCGFNLSNTLDYTDCATQTKFRVQSLSMNAGIGTHIDAPAHCFPGGQTIAEIPLEKLLTPCVVIDVSHKAHAAYKISVNDIKNFETQHSIISTDTLVIIRTGWEQYWHEPSRYHNNWQFPSVSQETAQYLVDKNIVGLGIDTLSPDILESDYPVHRLMLGVGNYIIENVANSSKLPATGAYTLALPLKIQGGTEAPIRFIGLLS
ncbi:cyclase family protein [Candidatus Dependentiae bacterium]|nr:cyclase family protein [Candidatus Dependentiae bacterium]